jgi:hypothetical protein
MMKVFYGAMILLVGALTLRLPFLRASKAPGGPHLVLEVTKRDLGRLDAGATGKLRFPLRNAGSEPLQILSVQGDCGCMTPTFPRSVPPGGSASIDSTFEPQPTWSGVVEKSLTVSTNDPAQPELKLAITVEVVPYLRMDPPNPLTLPFVRGKTYVRDVVLTPRAGSKLGITNAACDNPLVKPTLQPPSAGDSKRRYRLRLAIGPVDQPGDFAATVKMMTSEQRLPEAWLVVAGQAQSGPVVSPREIVVPESAGGANHEFARLQVFTRGAAMKLLRVDTGIPALRAEINPKSPGHMYEVVLLGTGKAKPGELKTTLKVRTDDPATPVIQVPFQAAIR